MGYQGAAGALIQMGALRMGLHEDELPDIVQRWRASNKRIVDLWYSIERHAAECVEYGVISSLPNGISFSRDTDRMMVTLPSGRKLFYLNPQMIPDERNYKRIYFMGQNQKSHKWDLLPDLRRQTHGEYRTGRGKRLPGQRHGEPAYGRVPD